MWNNPQITQNIIKNIGQHLYCSKNFNNVRAKPWRLLFWDYWDDFKQVNVGWKLATKSIKARLYEEISSVHTIYNRYVQKAIKHWFKAPPVKKTRRNQDEAELFQDRIVVSARESVTPLKLQKAGDSGDWVVEKSNKHLYQGNELVALDPFRTETNLYHLVHRDDTKNCPKKVTRCEYCKILFTNADIVLIKTKGKIDSSLVQKRGKKNVM